MNTALNSYCFRDKIVLHRDNQVLTAGCCIIKGGRDLVTGYLSQLHFLENEYYHSLKSDRRKESYLLGRMAARNAIAEIIIPEKLSSVFIGFGVFQFPVVKGLDAPNLQVSISHTDNIAMALTFEEEHPMGVDIEKVNEDIVRAIREHVSEQELSIVSACGLPLSVGCTVVWSMKEGVSKVLRTGMMADFNILEIDSMEWEGSFYKSTFRYFKQYKALAYYVNGYVCTVVLPKNTKLQLTHFFNAFATVTKQGQ